MAIQVDPKDPAAVLDYGFDWAIWLEGDTIATSTWTLPTGITQTTPAPSFTTTTTTIWLLGGTAGVDYEVTNRITTVAGRTNERSLKIPVRNQ